MNNDRRKNYLLLFGIVAWLLTVLIGYYYYHKPIKVDDIVNPLLAGVDIIAAILIISLCGGLGRKILTINFLPPIERAIVQFSLGAGVFSLIWLIIGALGLYRFPVNFILLLGGWGLLFRQNIAWCQEFLVIRDFWKNAGGIEKTLSLISGLLVTFQLLIALNPPVRWDTLAYHLQLPRQYLAIGAIKFIPENPYWGHPQLVEMLYSFAMSLHRAETATVLCWFAAMLTLLGIFSFANTLTHNTLHDIPQSSLAGWVAVTSLLVGTTFRFQMSSAYTDIFSALFGLATLLLFSQWLENRKTRWFFWVGIFCGLAMGSKWTSVTLAMGIFLAALFFHLKDGGHFKSLLQKIWLPGAAAIFLSISPWLIKNLIATGNPIYPYFFSTPWISAARMASGNPLTQLKLWQYLLLPLSITWSGVEGAPGFTTDLGPLLLFLAVPGFWFFRKNRFIQSIGIILAVWAVTFSVASQRFGHLSQTRLYFAILPGMGLLAGLGWIWLQKLNLENVRLRRIIGTTILLVSLLVAWQDINWQTTYNPISVIFGHQSRQTYLENTMGMYTLAIQELEKLPPQSFTLMLWEPRGFYAPLNTQADLWIDRWRTDRRELQTAPAILKHWKDQGFTHLLVYQLGVELIKPETGQPASPDWIVFQDMLALLPEPTKLGDTYFLYDLR